MVGSFTHKHTQERERDTFTCRYKTNTENIGKDHELKWKDTLMHG